MHEEQDTLWHFVTSIVKYRESHYVTVLDMYDTIKPDIFFFISPDFVLFHLQSWRFKCLRTTKQDA